MSTKQEQLQEPLTARQIDFRIQSINRAGKATVLVYKDARVDMQRLNSAYGVGFWQRKHELIGTKEFCSVGVWNDDIKDWCWVQDTGTKSNTEAEKGQSSDAFKRACFNLGIGIELYGYPLMQIQLNGNGTSQNDEWHLNDKKLDRFGKPSPQSGWGLKLKEWKWYTEFDDDGQLSFIAAQDQKGKVRFKWGDRRPAPKPEIEQPK